MKQTGKRWFIMGLILLGLMLPVVTAVALDAPADITGTAASHQIVQLLIPYFADPACTSAEAINQQAAFNATRPTANCWLVYKVQDALNPGAN